jgi:hypothetical protein
MKSRRIEILWLMNLVFTFFFLFFVRPVILLVFVKELQNVMKYPWTLIRSHYHITRMTGRRDWTCNILHLHFGYSDICGSVDWSNNRLLGYPLTVNVQWNSGNDLGVIPSVSCDCQSIKGLGNDLRQIPFEQVRRTSEPRVTRYWCEICLKWIEKQISDVDTKFDTNTYRRPSLQ